MSQKPGMSNWPRPSMTRVFFASGTTAECETNVMRSPLITTMESGCTEDVAGLRKGGRGRENRPWAGFFFWTVWSDWGGATQRRAPPDHEWNGAGWCGLGGGH